MIFFGLKNHSKVLNSDQTLHFYKWFEGGKTNTCYNALDLHIHQWFEEIKLH